MMIHRHVVFHQELADGVHRNAQRLILGEAEGTGGDERERDRAAAGLLCQRKARPVAGREQLASP